MIAMIVSEVAASTVVTVTSIFGASAAEAIVMLEVASISAVSLSLIEMFLSWDLAYF